MLGDDEDLGMCPCGSAWFEICVPEGADWNADPAVCISSDGSITGYAGILRCVDCNTDWSPEYQFRMRRHLRVVL